MSGFMKMTRLDFITMKSQFWSYLSLLLIIILFWTMGSSITLLCLTASWFVALFSQTIFTLQEKNNLDRLYGSVSINIKDVVKGRYMFTFLNFILPLFAIIILYAISALFQNEALRMLDIATGISLSFLIFSVITGVQSPIFFKMGYTKAKVWALVPFVSMMFIVMLHKPLARMLSGMIAFMQTHQGIMIISGLAVGIVIQVISYRASVAAYRKRR